MDGFFYSVPAKPILMVIIVGLAEMAWRTMESPPGFACKMHKCSPCQLHKGMLIYY